MNFQISKCRRIRQPERLFPEKSRIAIMAMTLQEAEMKARKLIITACIGLALFMAVPSKSANADGCCCCNPLLFPVAVAGAVVGTAAAIATAPFRPWYGPCYYGPPAPVAYYGPGPYSTTCGFAAIITVTEPGSPDIGAISFRPGCVNLRDSLCGVPEYASAQPLDFLAMAKNVFLRTGN